MKYENQQYHLCDRYYSSKPCFILPTNFEKLIQFQNLDKEVQGQNNLRFLLKVKFGKDNQINEVLAGNIIRENEDETSEVIAQWPIPEGYFGSGSQPFYIDIE